MAPEGQTYSNSFKKSIKISWMFEGWCWCLNATQKTPKTRQEGSKGCQKLSEEPPERPTGRPRSDFGAASRGNPRINGGASVFWAKKGTCFWFKNRQKFVQKINQNFMHFFKGFWKDYGVILEQFWSSKSIKNALKKWLMFWSFF